MSWASTISFTFLLSNKTEDKRSEMRWAPDSPALLKISNHHTHAEGAAKQGRNKLLGKEWRPEHNVVYKRSLIKAPENENRKGEREREEKIRVLALQYRKRRTEEDWPWTYDRQLTFNSAECKRKLSPHRLWGLAQAYKDVHLQGEPCTCTTIIFV